MSQPLRILLTGSSGFIGSNLKSFLEQKGYLVVCLKRFPASSSTDLFWDPTLKIWNSSDFEGFDVVIHLAGEGIVNKKWSKKRKEELLLSRCRDTENLAQILSKLSSPPQLFIVASAIGFYGNGGNQLLTEESPQGKGFLANLCYQWEQASKQVEQKGIRLIHSRFGLVIGKGGGILHKILPFFRLGLGGRFGSGKQIVSWISLQDLLEGMEFCIKTEDLKGAINFVSPQPIEQKRFVQILAKTLKRPALCHLPAWLLSLLLGDRADELLLTSQRVEPRKLILSGFKFAYPDLETVFRLSL